MGNTILGLQKNVKDYYYSIFIQKFQFAVLWQHYKYHKQCTYKIATVKNNQCFTPAYN